MKRKLDDYGAKRKVKVWSIAEREAVSEQRLHRFAPCGTLVKSTAAKRLQLTQYYLLEHGMM